jgi:23S rRNA (guanosine2251-2'-O)-methyltransferase
LAADQVFDRLYIPSNQPSSAQKALAKAAQEKGVPVLRVPEFKLNKLAPRSNHQGVIALISPVSFADLDNVFDAAFARGEDPFIVVLDRVSDVRNFGAIARTAECQGAHALLIPTKGAAALSGDAMKTSAGALNHLPICRYNPLEDKLVEMQQKGLRIAAITEKGDASIMEADLSGPLALVLGSEENGIRIECLKRADLELYIPMSGQVGSLNVSVAAGMSMYEVQRQRKG